MTELQLPDTLAGRNLVVVDVEGNGRQPPEIIELALLPLSAARTTTTEDLRSWLIRPTQPITPLVTNKVHGITNDDVATSPSWTQVADQIAAALTGLVVVAHNATVERRVLAAHLPGWEPPTVLDTMKLARHVWPKLPGGYSLDHLIAHINLDPPPPAIRGPATGHRRHRAGYDTWITAGLLVALINELFAGGDPTWPRLTATAALPTSTINASSPAGPVLPGEQGLW